MLPYYNAVYLLSAFALSELLFAHFSGWDSVVGRVQLKYVGTR